MKKRDRRNLTKRGGMIYYQRVVNGARVRFSCETTDWSVAAQVRDLYEARKGIGRLPAPILESPTLRDFARRYLKEDTRHLAASTRSDRHVYLKARTEDPENPGQLLVEGDGPAHGALGRPPARRDHGCSPARVVGDGDRDALQEREGRGADAQGWHRPPLRERARAPCWSTPATSGCLTAPMRWRSSASS